VSLVPPWIKSDRKNTNTFFFVLYHQNIGPQARHTCVERLIRILLKENKLKKKGENIISACAPDHHLLCVLWACPWTFSTSFVHYHVDRAWRLSSSWRRQRPLRLVGCLFSPRPQLRAPVSLHHPLLLLREWEHRHLCRFPPRFLTWQRAVANGRHRGRRIRRFRVLSCGRSALLSSGSIWPFIRWGVGYLMRMSRRVGERNSGVLAGQEV